MSKEIKDNGGRPSSIDWIAKAEVMFWRQHQKEMIKAWEETRPVALRKLRTGSVIIFGTKGEDE